MASESAHCPAVMIKGYEQYDPQHDRHLAQLHTVCASHGVTAAAGDLKQSGPTPAQLVDLRECPSSQGEGREPSTVSCTNDVVLPCRE